MPRTLIDEAAPPPKDGGERVPVGNIRFSGNTASPEPVLQRRVAGRGNASMSLDELAARALRVTRYYREHDYLAARAQGRRLCAGSLRVGGTVKP